MQKQSSQNNEKKTSTNNKKLQQIDKQFYSEFLSFQYDKEDDEEYTLSYRPKMKSKRVLREQTLQREGLYLRAKFRFITSYDQVNDTSIYSPMKQLSWDKITQVLFPSQKGEITCPICMNDPFQIVAPQITPCGHIFCWHCYLRHDDISDTKGYCPLCSEYAPRCDLKSARISENEPFNDKIGFQLLVRLENEQIVYKADTLTEDIRYSKIMIAKNQYILNDILFKEKLELDEFMKECISSQETWNIPYIEQALEINEKKIEKIEKLILQEEQQRLVDSQNKKKKSSKQNGSPKQEQNQADEDMNFYLKQLKLSQLKKQQLHYFYQEENGQQIYLNPINNKYLFEEINKENKEAPPQISAKLISLQNSCVDQNLLRRYPYLKHLPPFGDILFAEIEMSELIMPENAKRNDSELGLIHKKLKEKEDREQKKMAKNRKLSDNPYGQYYDREYYMMNGMITFPPSTLPTEEKHYPSLQGQNAQSQLDEEQKEKDELKKKKEKNSDDEDDYVIVSKTGELPKNYVDKTHRQNVQQMKNEQYFPSLGGFSNVESTAIAAKIQQNKKKVSTEIQKQEVANSTNNSLQFNDQPQLNNQLQQKDTKQLINNDNDVKNTQIGSNSSNIELAIQNESKQVIFDYENNVIIDKDQIYDEWTQQAILSNAINQGANHKNNKNSTLINKNDKNTPQNNNNRKKNKKVALDGNFFF